MLRLCECGQRVQLAALLDALPADGIGASGRASLACPACGAALELRLRDGKVEAGFTYSSGDSHFEVLRDVKAPGLRVTPRDPDDLEVHLDDRRWRFGVRRPSNQRIAVLPGAWAEGRLLGELELGDLGVAVEACEREGLKQGPDPGIRLQAGEFLHLSGPQPALLRAWMVLNHGPGRGAHPH
jgi:hypothetical protein